MSGKHGNENEEQLSQAFWFKDTDPTTTGNEQEEQLVEIEDTRDGEHLLTGLQGAMMLFKFSVGTGWLTLPVAFKHSGILVGVLIVILIGTLTSFGMRKIVESTWEVSKRTGKTVVSFGDVGEECANGLNIERKFLGRFVVNVVLTCTVFSMLCPSIVFVAVNWQQGFESLGHKMDTSIWMLVVFFFLVPMVLIKRPDILALLAVVANIIVAISSVSLFGYGLMNVSKWKANITVTWSKLPLTIGVASYAFEVAPFILIIENVMRKPKQTPLVINWTMSIVVVVYSLMGAIGYAACQDNCADSIILNLPVTWYFSVLKVFMGLTSCVSITLISFIGFDIAEPALLTQIPEERRTLVSFLLRVFILTTACGISAAVPELANLISFVGITSVSIIGFIFPAVAHTILLHKKLSKFSVARNIALMICGILLLAFGSYTSLRQIVKDY